MRAVHDAVMVGIGTALADDPELLARTEPPPAKQPARVILDTEFSLQPGGRLFASLDRAEVIVIGADDADGKRRAVLEGAGVRTMGVGRGPAGIDAEAALTVLMGAGIGSVFAEGGGQVAASLIAANAVDRLEWFRAPIVLGAEGRPAVAALALARLAEAPTWKRVALRELGPDLWESYERA